MVPLSNVTSVASQDTKDHSHANEIDLIVVGVSPYPVRRVFISELRRVYPGVPMLVLRREESCAGMEGECIRGEFILSDRHHNSDFDLVYQVRKILPMRPCTHMQKGFNFDIVREVVRVISQNYSDPELDLEGVANELPISPYVLSRILNQQVGLSFRQLLRQVRIEEAKRMLASRRYSVKEVAAKVGFADSHYFSRSFREVTGLSASEYRLQDAMFG
jgi:AraC-like DNA-binding protein